MVALRQREAACTQWDNTHAGAWKPRQALNAMLQVAWPKQSVGQGGTLGQGPGQGQGKD